MARFVLRIMVIGLLFLSGPIPAQEKPKEKVLALADIVGTWDGPDLRLIIEASGKGEAHAFDLKAGKVFFAYYTVDATKGAPRIAFKFTAPDVPKDKTEFDFLAISKPTVDSLVLKETKDRIKPNPITMNRRKAEASKDKK